jgi:uncharacterized protein with ParB-like and HNH nuclease domain
MEIKAEIMSLKKILGDDEKFYQIPDYQRPYSWNKENVSDLVSDLFHAYESSKDENYFCGSLVLVKNDRDKRFDIIDGQQRTTTFTILACVIRDIFFDDLSNKAKDYISQSIQDKYEENKRKLKFLTNEQYQLDFEKTVLEKIDFKETKIVEKDKELSKNKYLKNAHYVRDFLQEQFKENQEIKINDFVVWLFENVVLTVITCPNEDSAIQIFNVLNDRGMPLSPTDILKASLMQKLSSDEDRKTFKRSWEDTISRLQFYNYFLDDMLTTYLYYKIAKNPESRIDKELLSVFEKEKITALQIIKEISDFSIVYIDVLNLQNKYLYCLKYLQHKIYWTSILITAKFTDYKEFDRLLSYLVAYYYQNWVAGATVARIKQTSFNILKAVKENNKSNEIKIIIEENLKYYSTTENYEDELDGSYIYGRNWDKPILLLAEYFSTDSQNQAFIPITSQLHLEHILPQTTNKYWDSIFTEEEKEEWTNALANLTLLALRKNIQAKNDDFETKKKIYKDKDNKVTSFVITQDILNEEKWNLEVLEARQKKLINKIDEIVNIFGK